MTIGTIGQPFWRRKNALSFVPIVTGSRRQVIDFRKRSMTSLISKDLSDLLEAFARRSCTRRKISPLARNLSCKVSDTLRQSC